MAFRPIAMPVDVVLWLNTDSECSAVQVVVYTSQLPTYADPILDRLDPHRGCIAYRSLP